MSYRLPPWRPRPAPKRKPSHVPAVHEMLIRETFTDLPFGGYAGEMLPNKPAEPAPPPPTPFVIEPPPWQAELEAGNLDLASLAPPEPPAPQPPQPVIPPPEWAPPREFVLAAPAIEPLRRPEFPAPDWRQEEVERNRKPPQLTEPEKSLKARPA